ncbi:hypothetical protein BASA81_016256 [Batrachochytrium salamandrivorans]|nr:hypothetical protein BASA81_016256 [Batrachochytrium salamandrivorans]
MSSNTNASAASEAASEVLRSARASQRLSQRPDPRKFTLNREAAKRIRDASICQSLAVWLEHEVGRPVRGEEPELFAEDLESGVVFCLLASKFGQITRFKDPPLNEFQRMENFELFSKAMKRFGLTSQMPPSKRGAGFSAYLPCLLELAVLAKDHSSRMEMDSHVPEGLVEQAEHQDESPIPVVKQGEEEEEDSEGESMNQLLGQLHLERMQRQRAGPPKLRLVDVGGRQLVCIERPGESLGSIVWPGSVSLVNFLHTHSSIWANNEGTILELGSGCGLCGIWCASEGKDVVVSDLAGSVDLLWANVAANAQQVVKGGGSCSARALDFADQAQVLKLVKNLPTPLTVVGADVVYGEAVLPLIQCLRTVFSAVPSAVVLIAYKERDVLHEQTFFQSLGEYAEVGSFPECKIFQIKSMAT